VCVAARVLLPSHRVGPWLHALAATLQHGPTRGAAAVDRPVQRTVAYRPQKGGWKRHG